MISKDSSAGELHEQAVFGSNIGDIDRYLLLTTAAENYDSPFDTARALRDKAKLGYRLEKHGRSTTWRQDLDMSIGLLIELLETDEDGIVPRELAATELMYGRLLLDESISQGTSARPAYDMLHSGMDRLSNSDAEKPDQYAANFLATTYLSERIVDGRLGLAKISKMWKYAFRTTSQAHFEHVGDLGTKQKIAARGRACLRAATVSTVNALPGTPPQPRLMTKILVEKTRVLR